MHCLSFLLMRHMYFTILHFLQFILPIHYKEYWWPFRHVREFHHFERLVNQRINIVHIPNPYHETLYSHDGGKNRNYNCILRTRRVANLYSRFIDKKLEIADFWSSVKYAFYFEHSCACCGALQCGVHRRTGCPRTYN